MKKGRGRPPSQETIEMRRIEEMFKNQPEHIKQADLTHQDGMLKNLDETEAKILSDYKSYPTVPHSHIFEMASVGDESLQGYDLLIIERDDSLKNDIQIDRQTGSNVTKENAAKIAKELCEKNKILLERMKPFGNLSKSETAKRIKAQWKDIPVESRQPGEENLACRGVDDFGSEPGKIPSVRTIERYIDIGSPFTQQRVRQGSGHKK
jgi:hypothetical protein